VKKGGILKEPGGGRGDISAKKGGARKKGGGVALEERTLLPEGGTFPLGDKGRVELSRGRKMMVEGEEKGSSLGGGAFLSKDLRRRGGEDAPFNGKRRRLRKNRGEAILREEQGESGRTTTALVGGVFFVRWKGGFRERDCEKNGGEGFRRKGGSF